MDTKTDCITLLVQCMQGNKASYTSIVNRMNAARAQLVANTRHWSGSSVIRTPLGKSFVRISEKFELVNYIENVLH